MSCTNTSPYDCVRGKCGCEIEGVTLLECWLMSDGCIGWRHIVSSSDYCASLSVTQSLQSTITVVKLLYDTAHEVIHAAKLITCL